MMWISRKEFDALRLQVETLQSDVSQLKQSMAISVPTIEGNYAYHAWFPRAEFPLRDVVYQIIDHLGMKVVYRRGNPAGVALEVPIETKT